MHNNSPKKASIIILVSLVLAGIFCSSIPVSALDKYLVVPGDSVFQISKKYKVSIDEIMQFNNLKNDTIYAGQTLLIPVNGRYHMVAQGESIYHIAKLYSMSSADLKQLNKLSNDTIYPGQNLRINAQGYKKPKAMVIGYYTDEEADLGSSYWSALTHMNRMSRLAPFWFRLDPSNPAKIETMDTFSEAQARKIVEAAHAKGIQVIPVIHNFLYQDRKLPKKVVNTLVSSQQNRKECISNIINLIEYYNFDGVNMDFEGISAGDRQNLSLFYQELGQQLKAKGYIFTVAVPAKSQDSMNNPWSAPYDYAAIGKAADQVMLMMYNEHGFPGSGSGPISSIGFNHSVIKYAVKTIPPHKIILAEPVFGFDFNLKTGKYDYLLHESVMQRARDFKAVPAFDFKSRTPFFTYIDSKNNRHEVWYENALSLKSKLDLISQYDLGGVALWRLGMEDPAIWPAIQEKVIIE